MYDFPSREEHNELKQQLAEFKTTIDELVALLDEYVPTKTAMKITGISRDGLEAERKRPNTLLRFKKEGRTPLYSRRSLSLYNQSKHLLPYVTTQRMKLAS
ncbi:hypothetical protein [Hymenobacter koreensis]|uniref:DNA-binding protein n=1 Tax=Hymenobacter koreensis TaxID=1084523 RepID=A0ABP8JKC3_9BACT